MSDVSREKRLELLLRQTVGWLRGYGFDRPPWSDQIHRIEAELAAPHHAAFKPSPDSRMQEL